MKRTIRVLYAEDNPLDADLTKTHFEQNAPDFEMEVVGTGERCLQRIEQAIPDVLLLDNHLPDMDGVDVLKALADQATILPIVVVTALGDETLVIQVLRLGACDYVAKEGSYLERLPSVLQTAVTEFRKPETDDRRIGKRTRHILYVEQNAADIDLTIRYFAEAAPQFRLEVARSSRQAFSLLQKRPFDLVLVDLRMPDMNGLDFLVEAKHASIKTPFIITTGRGDESAAVAALKLGAYDYIVKRENYLTQLPYAVDNAIARAELLQTNRRLQTELAERERAEAENAEAAKARAQLEEQLRQAQKIESIGRLAGGVAHDFNNLLTVINGYAHLVLVALAPGDPLHSHLTAIREAGDRAADLTRQLLAFSRRQVLHLRVLGLNSLITDSISMLQRLLGEDIELVTILDSDLGQIMADAGQMDQVIVNLAVNARDAMPRGGRLTLETRNLTITAENTQLHLPLQPGAYVQLTISDTGFGMDAEILPHIFEPFFTTKEPGRGTGLGLSTVYGIISQIGGAILVSSELGRGTHFRICLPRVEAPAEIEEKRAEPESPRGSETLLVVEDEELVRHLTCDALRKYGYQVIEAANAGEALLACEKHSGPIPLMITDVVMPHMSGRELAERLQRVRPDLRVLYISGYIDDAVVRHGLNDPSMMFLQKPFTPSVLAHKVREILQQ